MFTPAYATAYRDAALVINRASVKFWTAFRPHRDVSTSLGISAAVHLVLLLGVGAALYVDGNDDADIPELSVQLETREGPNDEEFTEASLPQPAPDPVEDVLDDPGHRRADARRAACWPTPRRCSKRFPTSRNSNHRRRSSSPTRRPAPSSRPPASRPTRWPRSPKPNPQGAADVMPQPEQVMLTRNVQQLAQKLLDTNTTATTISWQQDGQQYSARVMRQPAADSTGLEQVIAEIMTSKDGKRMKTRLSLKRLAFSHFTQLVNNWDPNIMLHDDVIDGRFHSNSEISLSAMDGVKPRFFGKVTTAAQKVTFNSFNTRRNKDVFQGGFETKTDRVTLPRDMPDVVNGGAARYHAPCVRRGHAHHLQRRRQLRLAPRQWRGRRCSASEPSEQPQYLIGEKGAKLYVRGTVRGIFTVYSPSDIEIEDDLVYLKDPRQTVISRDFLALISGRDIKIANSAVTGPGDLTVHAALFARRRFFTEAIDHARPATHVHLRQPDRRHDLGHRTALRHQARLRQALRIPAAGQLSDDAALRGRFLGPGLAGGRGRRKRPAGRESRPVPVAQRQLFVGAIDKSRAPTLHSAYIPPPAKWCRVRKVGNRCVAPTTSPLPSPGTMSPP